MYNAEPYIGQCLDSIISQGLDSTSYEVIIINDGSNDRSREIVTRYLKYHSNFRLFNQNNSGQSVARNYGMTKATGEYIQFIDADDFLIPDSLQQIVQFASSKNNDYALDMISFGIIGGYPDRVEIKNTGTGRCIWLGNGYDYIASHNYNNSPCYYWLKRSFVSKFELKFEEGKLCEDGMFTMTAILNSRQIANIDSSVYFYAVRPNSTTTSHIPENRKKIADGFIYAINYFHNTLIVKGVQMNRACKNRITTRRDSYVFFLLIRLLKMGAYQEAKSVTTNLKRDRIYPIKYFIGSDYPGVKLRCFTSLVNCRPLYLTLCKLKSFF